MEFKKGTQEIDPIEWGSIIKLFEYQMEDGGYSTNIVFDLYNRVSLLLPKAGLPIRFFERRSYSGHSLESTMAGLSVRLENDSRENLEDNFPAGVDLSISSQKIKVQIFVFKENSDEKYRKKEGVLFTLNGQTHATLPTSFFKRKPIAYKLSLI